MRRAVACALLGGWTPLRASRQRPPSARLQAPRAWGAARTPLAGPGGWGGSITALATRGAFEAELCSGEDDDCDGTTDEDDAVDASTWYGDADADGYGDLNDPTTACNNKTIPICIKCSGSYARVVVIFGR